MSKIKVRATNSAPGKRVQLQRSDLLPMAAASFRAISLRHHLALVSLRAGHGGDEVTGELLKCVYLTYLASGIDPGVDTIETCVAAELTIKESIAHARMGGQWRLDARHGQYVETLLCRHDRQLTTLPRCVIDGAARKLAKMIEEGRTPDMAAIYRRELAVARVGDAALLSPLDQLQELALA